METQVFKLDIWNPDGHAIDYAANCIRQGKLVAFPTETVYGLGANALDPIALKRIYQAKGRPSDNPLILHLNNPAQSRLLAEVDERAYRVMQKFWPGPLTLVLQALPCVPTEATAGLSTVALRMPDHPVALALLESSAVPIAAPSANRSGCPSPTNAQAVWDDLNGRIDVLLDSGSTEIGLESTVVDLSGKDALLLRPGGISIDRLENFLGCPLETPAENEVRRSPGTRHRHYSPGIPVFIWNEKAYPSLNSSVCSGFIGMHMPKNSFFDAVIFDSLENYARGLFAAFRSLESKGVCEIWVEWPEARGIGLALQDRIRRAAQG